MLKPPTPHQHRLEMVTLEELVPSDHLLRLIDRHIPFDFIRDATAHLYSADNGRPAVDPVQLFKMLFIGYLFGIRSERQLVREIQVNVAYRWFLGLGLTDRVIDASTFSQNRRRRFSGTNIEQTIFDRIVEQAIEHGLIGGRVFYSDSTHLKASANKNRHDVHRIEQTPASYLADLTAAIDDDRAAHGKAPLPDKPNAEPPTKDIKLSRTDPDAGYMVRDGKPTGFFYLDHRTVDGEHALITDIHVTPANLHDSVPYLDRLDRMRQRFGFDPGICLDTRPVRRLPDEGAMHAKRQRGQGRHPPCVGRPQGGGGCTPPQPDGKTLVQAPQGDGGTQLCRCQGVAWTPVCPFPWGGEGERAGIAGRSLSEHEEDGAPAGTGG